MSSSVNRALIGLIVVIVLLSWTSRAPAQDVAIQHGIELTGSGSNKRIDAFVAIAIDNSSAYDTTDYEKFELYEGNGTFPVDEDDGNFDDTDQLGQNKWGGGWDVEDTSVQNNTDYCYTSDGVILDSNFGEIPVSLEFSDCRKAKPPSNANVVATLLYCVGNTPNYALSFYSSDNTIFEGEYSVERYVSGSWVPYYEGDSTCVVSQGGSYVGVKYRVQAENPMGTSGWEEETLLYNCATGGGEGP